MTPSKPRPRRDLSEAVAANIRQIRDLRGWTQAELATRVGLDSTAVAKIERRHRYVSIEEAWDFATAFEVTLDELVNYPNEERDRRFQTLVLSPFHEFHARLVDLRRLASGTELGSIRADLRRLAEGIGEYRASLDSRSGSEDLQEFERHAIEAAQAVIDEYPEFDAAVHRALEKLDDGPARLGITQRSEARRRSRVVKSRG